MTDAELKSWLQTQYDLNANGCWVWKGYKDNYGYGRIRHKGRMIRLHRLYWILSGQDIPEDLVMRHGQGCSKACYNPEHLTPGTQSENGLDMHRDGTMTFAKLTAEQVLKIRATDNKTRAELAKEYDVAHTTISRIILRKAWSHI
jgi:hypothetical protein